MIEISRVVTIGQYVPQSSIIHKLDPRIKILAAVTFIIVASIVSSFTALAALALFTIVLIPISKLTFRFILITLRPALFFIAFMGIFQILFYQQTSNQGVLWSWWILHITIQGIIASIKIDIRSLLFYVFINLITYTTTFVELTDGAGSLMAPLQKIGVPVQEYMLTIMIALKFVPLFIEQLEQSIKAQAARGASIDKGNFFIRAINISQLLIPLVLNGFQRAEHMAVALEARSYRGGKYRTKYRILRLKPVDITVMLFFVLIMALTLYINIRWMI